MYAETTLQLHFNHVHTLFTLKSQHNYSR